MLNDIAESWRTIADDPDYQVSDEGRVRSFKGRGRARASGHPFVPRILKLQTDPAGYVRVALEGGHRYVHRLVAEAWHGPCPPGKEVAHLNHVRDDNRAENLVYVTRQENLSQRDRRRSDVCRWGHKWTPENTYIVPSTGQRLCRECMRRRRKPRKICPTCGR